MRRSILLVTVALITAAMFAVGSPSAFAQGAEVSDVSCGTASEGGARLEGQQVVTPRGDEHTVCHGDSRRPPEQGAETFEQPCPTSSDGETTGSGVVAPSGETTFVCHGNDNVGGLPNE